MVNHDFDRSIVTRTAHRPWPMPQTPWLMTQTWRWLLFAHWRVDATQLRRMIAALFELDLFDGEVFLTCPGVNLRKLDGQVYAVLGVLIDRHQFACPPT